MSARKGKMGEAAIDSPAPSEIVSHCEGAVCKPKLKRVRRALVRLDAVAPDDACACACSPCNEIAVASGIRVDMAAHVTSFARKTTPAQLLPVRPWEIREGDALDRLRELPDACIDCCVTSPPYWQLRDYGVDGQIGLEKTPEEFLEKLGAVFDEVLRVLRPHGTLWLNMGDSYAAGGRGGGGSYMRERWNGSWRAAACANGSRSAAEGYKPKDMMMMPAQLALALRARGWWLRAEIVWKKDRPMPESVDDRPTRSHEMVYLLAKQPDYFYDAFALREPVSGGAVARGAGTTRKDAAADARVKSNPNWHDKIRYLTETRNSRDVWTIDTNPLRGEEHYAAFPEELARRCIAAGTSEAGGCMTCGAPATRVTAKKTLLDGKEMDESNESARGHARVTLAVRHVGWERTCTCGGELVPSVVLDPFAGSGTTGIVATAHGRHFLGLELNPKYVSMARRRIESSAPLFNRARGVVA